MSAPAISVIMATYKGAELVGETLASLFAQTFADWELVIVDDCSPDDTLAVLRAFGDPRITVIASEANAGPVCARNRAFAAARGRYVAALDQDDLCRPTRLEKQVAYLDAHPEVVLAGTGTVHLEEGVLRPGRLPGATTPALLDWLMLTQNPLAWSSVMFRGDAARRLDPFTRPDMLYVEDFDLYRRLRAFGQIARIDEELLVYRCHAGGASQKYRDVMGRNATRVLADGYAAVFGAQADESAALVVRHVMQRAPVPDLTMLARLLHIVLRLHQRFLAVSDLDAASRALIEREYSALWWRVVRSAVRSRTVRLRDVIAARPKDIPLSDAASTDLLLSSLVGRVRRIGRS